MIGNHVKIGKNNVSIDASALIDDGVCIENNVRIKENVKVGRNSIIKDNVEINKGAIIEENCIIGYDDLTRIWDEGFERAVVIGENTLIRNGCTIYIGCRIGENSKINHNVVLREKTRIGDHTSLGCLIKCEGYIEIGSHCSIHAQTHLSSFMKIEDYVFMGPHCVTANDAKIDYKRNLGAAIKGPTIKYGARIGSGAILCPGVIIGREAFVGAGSVVIKNINDFAKVFGVPAKEIGTIREEERLKL